MHWDAVLLNWSWPAAQPASPAHSGTGELKTKHVLLSSLTPRQAGAPVTQRQGQGLPLGWVVIVSAQNSKI